MAKGDHSDLYMAFLDKDSRPVAGESRASLKSSDTISKGLLDGFNEKAIFEIDSFNMSAQVSDDSPEELKQQMKKENARTMEDYKKRQREGKTKPGEKPPTVKSDDQIKHDVETKITQDKMQSPVKEITFTRDVDTSSQKFVGNIVAGLGYKKATLIKRKAGGHRAVGTTATAGDVYLRIDFHTVLVTSVSWSDSDGEIKEECKFICKSIKIKYRPQLPSGKLGAIVPGEWEYTPPPQTGTT